MEIDTADLMKKVPSYSMKNIYPPRHGYTHNSLPRPAETAVIFDTSARSGEIKCPVNYSKNRCSRWDHFHEIPVRLENIGDARYIQSRLR